MDKFEIQKVAESAVATSLDGQIELLKLFNLPSTAIERNYVRKEVVNGKTQLTLCKRERPIKVYDNGSGLSSVSRTMGTYADGINISKKKGKYNDEDRFMNGSFIAGCESVEVGEVEAFASI